MESKHKESKLQEILYRNKINSKTLQGGNNNTTTILKEKENQQQEEEKIKQAIITKEIEFINKLKEKELLMTEEFMKQLNEINKTLQEKTIENEKLMIDLDILKSKSQSKQFEENDKLADLQQKIFVLEADNENLKLKNKLNTELIAQLEIKSMNEKDKFFNTESTINNEIFKSIDGTFIKQSQNFKKEILNIELKSHVSKLEQTLESKEKLIENLKEKIKGITNESTRKEIDLKNNLHENKNKNTTDLYKKIQSLEFEKSDLLLENEILKNNLDKAFEKIKLQEDIIRNKSGNFDSLLDKEKAEKEIMVKKLKEMANIYKENHERLFDEAQNLKDLLNKKDDELEKTKIKYESRIQKVI